MIRAIAMLVLLGAGAALATMGTPDRRVELSAVFDFWRDVWRDADQVTLKATRVSDAEEIRLGKNLATNVLASHKEDADASIYVTAVAGRLLAGVTRPGIPYEFHVIDSPGINAFALPGGQIFVLRGMLDFAGSEAELASVLGHEIAHVDRRHCIEHYQYQLRLGRGVEFLHTLLTVGFGPEQEREADAEGERLAVEGGYDPTAASTLFFRMKRQHGEASRTPAATPAGEAAGAVGQALGDFFRTHPPSADRAAALARIAQRFQGREFYVGRKNLKTRTSRGAGEYADEFRRI